MATEYPYYENCYLLSELPQEFKDPSKGLCIGCASFYSPGELEYQSMGINSDYPSLILPEYNFPCTYSFWSKIKKTTGLGRHNFGIFINQNMIKRVEKDKIFARDPLEHLSELTDQRLLEDIQPRSQSIQDYSQKNKLFFGYAHKTTSHLHFIRAVVHSEKMEKKISIVF